MTQSQGLTAFPSPAATTAITTISPLYKPRRFSVTTIHTPASCINMACKLLLVLATLVALSAASYVPQDSYRAAPANYDFNWAVNDAASGNNYAHQEARDGDNTQGYYFVQLPDGRLQKVTYSVQGDSGFLAEVTYEGEAQYPQQGYGAPARHPTPTYGTPGPQYAR
ncbi:cuticle protein 7-like isoform X1 [Portunus trituberculatus]|uniref:cuticle protein 7-like isoform X1 n=2 Tax=Portunus trituberculatus TaxID=210409 RepID=UPI001E1D0F37|nr:cuticle protein 7-like isoform X1 [Portunus trituberculatus]